MIPLQLIYKVTGNHQFVNARKHLLLKLCALTEIITLLLMAYQQIMSLGQFQLYQRTKRHNKKAIVSSIK